MEYFVCVFQLAVMPLHDLFVVLQSFLMESPGQRHQSGGERHRKHKLYILWDII